MAIGFYEEAFGAQELFRIRGDDDRIVHSEIAIGGSVVMLGDPGDSDLYGEPRRLGGCTASLHLMVDDNEALLRRATAAGAEEIQPVAEIERRGGSALAQQRPRRGAIRPSGRPPKYRAPLGVQRSAVTPSRIRLLTVSIVMVGGVALLLFATPSSSARSGAPEPVARHTHCSSDPAPFIHDSFPEPEVRHSKHGLLDTTLHAATGPTPINGQTYVTSAYDASFPGPTLVFCPGDTVKVGLENSLDPAAFPGRHDPGTTNLHTHGLHVSPEPPQDNVFIAVPPNGHYDYAYDVPSDEPPGAYWYHPHFHGQSSPQTAAGMAGAIVVEGGLDNRPDYHDYGRRVLVIQRTALGDGVTLPTGGDVPPSFFVNGWRNPAIPIRPGEIQRWSIFNATNGFFVNLELGAQSFELLARDGNYLAQRQQTHTLLVPPGSRREVLVQGGPEGSTALIAVPFEQFPGDTPPQETLATVVSGGSAEPQSMPKARITRLHDLRHAKVDHEHKIVYTENRTLDPVEFYINGKMFDETRVDQVMHLGAVEEWKITNSTDEWHTFHIHINDFQVIKVDDTPVDGVYNADNIEIAPGSTVTMRTRPTRYTGKFVFHCHVLGHEDLGMMATVVVKS